MLHNKSFLKKTKKGGVRQIVREHYLRDDIWSGSPLDSECDPSAIKLSADATHYLVIDTNVALHQIDLLEHTAINDVIVCTTVLQEVQHQNQSAYQRLRMLCGNADRRFYVFANEHHRETYVAPETGESPNDRNDRAIRQVVKWYSARLPSMRMVMLSDDAASRAKASAEGLVAMRVRTYAASREDAPELKDMVAAWGDNEEAGDVAGGDEAGGVRRKRQRIYEDHKTSAEVAAGLKAGKYHQGVLRVNRFNPFEGWVASESVGEDILVSGRATMNRAIDGDVVALELLPEDQWRGASATLPSAAAIEGAEEGEDLEEGAGAAEPAIFQVAPGDALEEGTGASRSPTARVVGIIKRNWRSRGYAASLRLPPPGRRAGQSVLAAPVDRKFPLIRIQTRQAESLADKRIVVVMDSWDLDSMHPNGHYVRTLGTIGDRDTETEVLLLENDINTAPFTPAVHACVPPLPWSVSADDLADPHRADLRHLIIASVDPPGCKDIDDALHVRQLPNGNYEVGVHIADVTHFVRPATAIDQEAAARATTVYLVQRRIDMLPKPLTEDICSLRCNVERLAFSVLWEMTPEADIVSSRFTKSVISSRASLTYAEAQAKIDDERLQDELSVSLRIMNKLGKILRRKRADAGALQLASPEVKFEIDRETQDPLDVGMYQTRETNQMVEELMLLANCSVAAKIVEHYPAFSMLRRHQTPAPRRFDPVLRAAAVAGFVLDISTSKALSASLDAAVRPDDPYFNKLVRILTTRCMTQALYFASGDLMQPDWHHYGLASPIYTHFTSPIRRYADVLVHRLLAAALGIDPLPECMRSREDLRALADNCNVRHHNAQMAGRSSVELHTVIFFSNRTVVADARITRVKKNGIIVFVPKYGIEGPVYFSAAEGRKAADDWTLDEEAQCVVSKDGGRRHALFDKVAVRIEVVTTPGRSRALQLSLVDREQLTTAEQVV